MVSIPNWVWYTPTQIYPLATTNSAGFQAAIVGTQINLASYRSDSALEDTGDPGVIEDTDTLAPAGGDSVSSPPVGEGITIGGVFRPIQTFAVFSTTFVTTGGQSLTVPVVAYQFADGSVAFRLDAAGKAIVDNADVFREDLQSVTFNAFTNYFRSAGTVGHSAVFFPCYAAGTRILTDRGERPVESLQPGDVVGTPVHGFSPIRWVGQRRVAFPADGSLDSLRPVRIDGAAFGPGAGDLTVSPQHRVLIRSRVTRRMFGTDEVLVPAIALVASGTAQVVADAPSVTYCHFMCDSHQVVQANGVHSESLYLGRQARLTLGAAALREILQIFPELRAGMVPKAGAVLVPRRTAEALVARHLRNKIALIESAA